ncbi:MAG: glycosyltransferase family 4 protein [Desulfovibrionaceae bacterium]|nr:glycosyltransferase family 4 protein [Desulfovibrionaceae bacterium]MBF0513150.1 glycosyltransferase family 4 protein [Desulfovibrionaceae bacterium]
MDVNGRHAGPLVAVTGTRGIPASWGGVERQCEELYSRLAASGQNVLVYARKGYVPPDVKTHRGVAVRTLPATASKYLEAFVHTFLCILDMAFRSRPAIIHIYGQGPCLFAPLARLLMPRAKIFFTCGGLDWQRRKWPKPAARVIRLGEFFSARLTHCRVMVSKALADYYRERYGVDCATIVNGVSAPAPVPLPVSDALLATMGLAPRGYLLFVARLTPEKRVKDIIDAFLRSPRPVKLALVGDDASGGDYLRTLAQAAGGDSGVVFCGYRFGEELAALYGNALAFVTASELEGMPLSLLEAMSYGLPCLASDLKPHLEVLGDDYPWLFPVAGVDALGGLMDTVLAAPAGVLTERGLACKNRVTQNFSWDTAAASLARLYGEALSGRPCRL